MNTTVSAVTMAACGPNAARPYQNSLKTELHARLAGLWPEAKRISVRMTRKITTVRVRMSRTFSYHALGRTPEAAMAKLMRSAEANPYRPA